MLTRLWSLLAADPLAALLLLACGLLAGALAVAIWLWRRERRIRADANAQARRVIKGQVGEQLTPFLPGFPYRPSECLFLGKPVDLLVCEGRDDGAIRRIVFLEVKTGQARQNAVERSFEQAVKAGAVSYEVWRPDQS